MRTSVRESHRSARAKGRAVPATFDWLQGIKSDGFGLMVRRDGGRTSSPIALASLNVLAAKLCDKDYRARGRLAMTRAMPPTIAIDDSDRRIVIASLSAMVPASAVMTGTLN